jgi:hypothetical protein
VDARWQQLRVGQRAGRLSERCSAGANGGGALFPQGSLLFKDTDARNRTKRDALAALTLAASWYAITTVSSSPMSISRMSRGERGEHREAAGVATAQ